MSGLQFSGALIAGDIIFPQGCGRFFEGSAPDFWKFVSSYIYTLPVDTLVLSGHDYVAGNAAFALAAGVREPPAAPSALPPSATVLSREMLANPFLRVLMAPTHEAIVARGPSGQKAHILRAVEQLQGVAKTLHAVSDAELLPATRECAASLTQEQHNAAAQIMAELRSWKDTF